MIHALDYDDGHPVSLTHIGCVAVAASFAAAERMGKTQGKELLAAIVLGGDFVCRMGLASKPGGSALVRAGIRQPCSGTSVQRLKLAGFSGWI